MINKKAQEEITGFVLVVVIVSILFVIVFGIFVRSRGNIEYTNDKEISSFLNAVMQETSDCTNNDNYLRVSELLKECNDNKNFECSGVKVCDKLKSDFASRIEESWNFNETGLRKGYILNSTYFAKNARSSENVLQISKGTCQKSYTGALTDVVTSSGIVKIDLKICF
jgi:hypothetical protein